MLARPWPASSSTSSASATPRTGRSRRTRWRLTRDEAQARYGDGAECLEQTLEVRDVPDDFTALKFDPFRGRPLPK